MKLFKKTLLTTILTAFLMGFGSVNSYAGGGEGGEFSPRDFAMAHIADANEWHLFTWGDFHATVPLPCILYVPGEGMKVFSTSKFHHGKNTHEGFAMDSHGSVYPVNGMVKGGIFDLFAFKKSKTVDGVKMGIYYDFSITKNVATLLLTVLIMFLLFLAVAKAYRKREGQAPKGLQSFMEPLIIFVRDSIAIPNIGEKKYEKYMPYLLSVFFFIWIANMLGQIPFIGNPNLTGNIAVTLVLSLLTLILTTVAGNRHYWGHIVNPPAPFLVKLILVPIEIIGIISKPFALMIRLFANISAGHIIIISLTSLIFVFSNLGASIGGGIAGVAIAIPFVLFMSVIELLVAFLQAFIFAMLSALFIGLASKEHEAH